jgi:heptaprenyl diphosphate synthase
MTTYTLMSIEGMGAERERVEEALKSSVDAQDPNLTEMARHLILAGGKRLRPVFAIAAGWSGNGEPVPENVILGAAACELVHIGSLYHDDVMDESPTRRGVSTVNYLWGNRRAIVAGDFLLARASELAAVIGGAAPGLLARTITSLCEGQTEELGALYKVDRSIESYLRSIKGKTASLFATSARIGAVAGGKTEKIVEAAEVVGEAYGMAFQIVDDILDLTASSEALGKPTGHDMVEGVYTLPVLLALRSGAAKDLRNLLKSEIASDIAAEAARLVREGGGIQEALSMADIFAEKAEQAGQVLENSPAAEGLVRAAREMLEDLKKQV